VLLPRVDSQRRTFFGSRDYVSYWPVECERQLFGCVYQYRVRRYVVKDARVHARMVT